MRFADKIPYKDVTIIKAGGNSPDAAVSAARIGLSVGLLTHIGSDDNGRDCIDTLKENGIDTALVQIEAKTKTNYHYVLSYEAERTILIKHEAYNYKFIAPETPPSWIYLSSVGSNTLGYHEEIVDYLEQNPEIKLAFQPGTFQMKLGTDKLARLYKRTEVFFCNKEEAQRILGNKEDDIKVQMSNMRTLGPKLVCITDGPNGAYASDGENVWFIPMYPDPKPPVERTGAGDAFSSTVTAMLMLGRPIDEALVYGPVNSMNVVQYVGAQAGLLSLPEIEKWLAKAPENYKIKKI